MDDQGEADGGQRQPDRTVVDASAEDVEPPQRAVVGHVRVIDPPRPLLTAYPSGSKSTNTATFGSCQ